MIKTDSIDSHEVGKVVLVGIVITMPSYHIEWGVILHSQHIWREREREIFENSDDLTSLLNHLFCSKESSLVLVDDGVAFTGDLSVFKPGHRREEVTRIGKTIRS